MINELYSSSKPANLENITDGADVPSRIDIYNSKDFQTKLITDLIDGKKNVTEWMVEQHSGSMQDLTGQDDDRFNIDYTFSFKYKYEDYINPLTLYINGDVDVNWVGRNIGGSYFREPQHAQPEIDDKSLGRMLDLALFDNDGNEISLKWLTPELETKVAKSIIGPYL